MWANVEMHFIAKPHKTHYMMLGNQNALPMDRRQVVQEKKRLMGFLAALKRTLYAMVGAPVKLYLAYHLWGCNPTAAHSPHLLHHPDCLYPHVCLWTSLFAAPLKLCVCSSWSSTRRASSKTRIVGPHWIIPGLGASHRGKEGTRKKLDTGLTALIHLVSLLTPSKTDQLFNPSPGPPTQRATVTHSPSLTQGQDLCSWQQAAIFPL